MLSYELAHRGLRTVLSAVLFEHLEDRRILVLVLDLEAALFHADVGELSIRGENSTRLPTRRAPAERQVSSGLGPNVEMLVEPPIRRYNHASRLPRHLTLVLVIAFRPEQR